MEKTVRETLDGAQWLMLCGSLPPGAPPNFYGKLIAMARKKKVKTLLHASGDALREGIEESPTVVTPNQQEAERLLARTLLTRTQYLEAAERIRAMGPESVDPLARQPRRDRRLRGRTLRSAAAASRRRLPHRRGRCAHGRLCIFDAPQGECRRGAPLGRRRRAPPPRGCRE